MYSIYVCNYADNLSKSTYLLLVPLVVFLVSVSFHKPVGIKSFLDSLLVYNMKSIILLAKLNR